MSEYMTSFGGSHSIFGSFLGGIFWGYHGNYAIILKLRCHGNYRNGFPWKHMRMQNHENKSFNKKTPW